METLNVLSRSSSSPFLDGKYQGDVHVKIVQDEKTDALLISAKGERITLKTFQGSFYNKLQEIFQAAVSKHPNEFEDMKEIFGDPEARKNYANGKPQTDQEIEKRIEFNAKRAIDGNPFTGFAAVDNTTQKIIGFVSIGRGFDEGDSQSGLILNTKYQNKDYGKEIALLAGSLAYFYFTNAFEVGGKDKVAVRRFTATCRDAHESSVQFMKRLGFNFIRPLTEKERCTDQPASLYGVCGEDVKELLEKFIPIKNITWEVQKLSN